MNLYNLEKNNSIKYIKEKPFKLERDIQNVFENNLTTIMGLTLVKSEFSIKNKRIDTLAFGTLQSSIVRSKVRVDTGVSVIACC